MTTVHSLTPVDAHNGLLILEEAHMVLQIAQPTRIDSLMELIKNKKKDSNDKDKEDETGKKDKERLASDQSGSN